MTKRSTSCVYDRKLGMFRVIQSKGKSLNGAGFGVSWTVQINAEKTSNSEYLFIEEALFLHERGLVDVFIPSLDEDKGNKQDLDVFTGNPADTKTIYALLHEMKIPLSIYLTYSFLRSQTFIVLRHTADRFNIIARLECESMKNSSTSDGFKCDENKEMWKKSKRKTSVVLLKKELRKDVFHASVPIIFRDHTDESDKRNESYSSDNLGTTNHTNDDGGDQIAFDCYKPNGNFRKTNPGQPDFYVAITSYAQPSPPFPKVKALVQICNGIPFRLASVSDGGTVVMFNITDSCTPSIQR